MIWKNFTENEILNPLFDDCPVKNWTELRGIGERLKKTVDLLQQFRDFYMIPIQINSSYRAHDRNGSAHKSGHAVDWQLKNSDIIGWGHMIFESIIDDYLLYIKHSNLIGFRCFWEWSGKPNYGWIHTDTNYMISDTAPNNRPDLQNKKYRLMVGYPNSVGEMVYVEYEGKPPWEYRGYKNPITKKRL